ncbi:hypothetical protein PISMIDRAFT_19628 [Pisolithus microcarpus 441]|uniref:Uncharacterized protein n=1 Tax=Pisolithus microcarpus 441 TaxID=765257 RepID=A0A0C9Y2C0_9AGAM|nr:hypothetical protein PISMIDRAFT_19628 [Pisolithus microcarpus 441]
MLMWLGKSSSYNSCLLASISVYNQTPYSPPSLEGEEMETYVTELQGKLSEGVALGIYKQVRSLPPAHFAACHLHLPCIAFSIRRLGIQELCKDNMKVYHARVLGLGLVDFTTAEDLPLDGDAWEGDWESIVESGLDLEHNAGSDEAVPPFPLHAVPVPQVNEYSQALQMIAHLGQPFNALLLVQQPDRHYKRVATENEIVVWGLGTDVSSQNIWMAVLEIL